MRRLGRLVVTVILICRYIQAGTARAQESEIENDLYPRDEPTGNPRLESGRYVQEMSTPRLLSGFYNTAFRLRVCH